MSDEEVIESQGQGGGLADEGKQGLSQEDEKIAGEEIVLDLEETDVEGGDSVNIGKQHEDAADEFDEGVSGTEYLSNSDNKHENKEPDNSSGALGDLKNEDSPQSETVCPKYSDNEAAKKSMSSDEWMDELKEEPATSDINAKHADAMIEKSKDDMEQRQRKEKDGVFGSDPEELSSNFKEGRQTKISSQCMKSEERTDLADEEKQGLSQEDEKIAGEEIVLDLEETDVEGGDSVNIGKQHEDAANEFDEGVSGTVFLSNSDNKHENKEPDNSSGALGDLKNEDSPQSETVYPKYSDNEAAKKSMSSDAWMDELKEEPATSNINAKHADAMIEKSEDDMEQRQRKEKDGVFGSDPEELSSNFKEGRQTKMSSQCMESEERTDLGTDGANEQNKGDYDEEESDYFSVASIKNGSTESIDGGIYHHAASRSLASMRDESCGEADELLENEKKEDLKTKGKSDVDRVSRNEEIDRSFEDEAERFGKEAVRNDTGRPYVSGTDQTEDEFMTADERSEFGFDEREAASVTEDEVFGESRNPGSKIGDKVLDDTDIDDTEKGITPVDEDYDGYDTQDYLTADEHSEVWGSQERLSSDSLHPIRGIEKERIECNSDEDLVKREKFENEFNTDIEEYETADEMTKEESHGLIEDDDRSTIVDSDAEEKEKVVLMGDQELAATMDDKSYTEDDIEDGQKSDATNGDDIESDKVSESNITDRNEEDDEGTNENEKAILKKKKNFFSSMMAKKEARIAERIAEYYSRYETAIKGIAGAKERFATAKSTLPLMIIEKRIPKVEEIERRNQKLDELRKRLESYNIFNRKTNDYIENWRTKEGEVHQKKVDVDQFRRKTMEKQKLLMACKKRLGFLHSEIIRQEDQQLQAKRRTKVLTSRLDMLKLRQTEQRNIVNRRIEEAKKHCEMSVREAAKIVVVVRRVEMLRRREKELEDKIFEIKKEIEKLRKQTKEKGFDLERLNVQKAVKTMKRESGWLSK